MKKFLKTLEGILEQDEIENVDIPDAPIQPEIQPEPEVQPLSPESEVLLIRLIKKALVTEIDPNDVDSISNLGDINEKNAKTSLTTLLNIMKKYSTELDIET